FSSSSSQQQKYSCTQKQDVKSLAAAALRAFGLDDVADHSKEVEKEEVKHQIRMSKEEEEEEEEETKKNQIISSTTKNTLTTYVPPPLPLYRSDSSKMDTSQPPNTGIGVRMLWPSPEHIHDVPSEIEPLIAPGPIVSLRIQKKREMRITNADRLINRIVYDAVEASSSQLKFRNSKSNNVGGGRPGIDEMGEKATLYPWYPLNDSEDDTLIFESRFEGANLRRAVRVFENEYDLLLKPDVNTNRHTQWFYFEIKNMRANTPYTFNIINLLKSDSLYNQGMRPLMYSEMRAQDEQIGWRRCGHDILYYQNGARNTASSSRRRGALFYTFTVTMTFPHDNDTVYLAMCYPYSYTDMRRYIRDLEDDPVRSKYVRRRPLCMTLAGNVCDLLTVTSHKRRRSGGSSSSSSSSEEVEEKNPGKRKRAVVITARVHPGESNASWMMKGFLDYLTGSSPDAQILRDNFVFKIVPMLNPDGVVVGNYRCSLAGIDLNRSYIDSSRKLHPSIFYVKQMIKRINSDCDVITTVDLHGHSRKMNIFVYVSLCLSFSPSLSMCISTHSHAYRLTHIPKTPLRYGCENPKGSNLFLRERVFPRMLWKNAKVFSYRDCNFKVRKSKESTARVVTNREIGIMNSYTMEASFAGVRKPLDTCDSHTHTHTHA
ncbi:M14-type cytosolic carboxypeptidase, partial [bacterium]|nr:M14-type cytosolic carboxypeptidase [bacterium]